MYVYTCIYVRMFIGFHVGRLEMLSGALWAWLFKSV